MAVGFDGNLRTALHAVLTGDAALSAALVGIYDAPPQAADSADATKFPYIVYGIADSLEDDTATETGFDVLQRLHTWSRDSASAETQDIQDLLYVALHRQGSLLAAEISLNGYTVIFCDREGSTIQDRDPEGRWHGVCEYRIKATKD